MTGLVAAVHVCMWACRCLCVRTCMQVDGMHTHGSIECFEPLITSCSLLDCISHTLVALPCCVVVAKVDRHCTVCVHTCMHGCVHARVPICMCACVHTFALCMRACVCARVRACMRVCVRACVHACVHACVRACVRACLHFGKTSIPSTCWSHSIYSKHARILVITLCNN